MKIVLLVFLIFVCMLFPFYAVSNVYAIDTAYTVNFFTDVTSYTSQQVNANCFPIVPTAPRKLGHSFRGWSLIDSSQSSQPIVNVLDYKINCDTNFYAVFEPNTYSVTFNFYNSYGIHSSIIKNVTYMSIVEVPVIPDVVNGSSFIGWDHSTTIPITKQEIFTAQYSVTLYTVTYYDYDGLVIDNISKSGLEDISNYPFKIKEGYDFDCWRLDSGAIADSSFRLDSDISLYPVYSLNFSSWYIGLSLGWQIGIPIISIFGISLIVAIFRRFR